MTAPHTPSFARREEHLAALLRRVRAILTAEAHLVEHEICQRLESWMDDHADRRGWIRSSELSDVLRDAVHRALRDAVDRVVSAPCEHPQGDEMASLADVLCAAART